MGQLIRSLRLEFPTTTPKDGIVCGVRGIARLSVQGSRQHCMQTKSVAARIRHHEQGRTRACDKSCHQLRSRVVGDSP